LKNTETLQKTVTLNGPAMGLGVFIMIIGFACIFVSIGMSNFKALLLGIGLLLVAAILMLSIDGIAYDKTNNSLRLYKDYLLFTTGDWVSLLEYDSVSVYFQIDQPITRPFTNDDIQYKTYSVFLTADFGKKFLIKDYGDYNAAKKLQVLLCQKTGLAFVDEPIRWPPQNNGF
jgi:hypothetical protein